MAEFRQESISVTKTFYDNIDGRPVYSVALGNDKVLVMVTNLGCAVTAIWTPDKQGVQKNIVAGFEDLKEYKNNQHYFGCVVGRYANRIAGGKFVLDGQEVRLSLNDGINHLHGGWEGFNKKVWEISSMIHDEGRVGVVFEYRSRDGEEGYPGNLKVKVKYTLNGTRLSIRYSAVTDKRTPVNLCNHSYFNLTGFDNPLVTGHFLQINALEYTGKGETNTPTGDILKLSGTPLDFSRPKKIAENMDKFPADGGFDHNYVLSRQRSGEIVPAAELYEPETGRILRVFTDQPGIQLYTANWWDGSPSGRQHRSYIKHGAVALETQAFPDSPNHPNFPDTILNVGELYQSTTIYEFDNK